MSLKDVEPKAYLQGLIASKALIMISAEFCPVCTELKKVYQDMGVDCEVVELYDNNPPPNLGPYVPNIDAWWKAYSELTGLDPIPGIPKTWVGGKFVGNGDQTKEAINNGQFMGYYNAASGVANPKAYLEKMIAEKPLVMISAEFCPSSNECKEQFAKGGIEPHVIELYDKNFPPNLQPTVPNIDDWWKAYGEITGLAPTPGVPKTWLLGKFVGGGDDTKAKMASGELQQAYYQATGKSPPVANNSGVHFFRNGHLVG